MVALVPHSRPGSVWFYVPARPPSETKKAPTIRGFYWSEREDLNLRPLVSQTQFGEFRRTT
jgi:hypothetical protein